MSCYSFARNVYGPPADAIRYGCQNDGGGIHWSAVAHTEFGPIAGKATRSSCWYSFGGEEKETQDFSYIVAPEGKIVPVMNSGSCPPGAVSVGKQLNEGEEYYAAIAVCDKGLVPGKAKGDKCWYPWGGKEHETTLFMWLVCL